jgi:sulfur carrier protein ThiS
MKVRVLKLGHAAKEVEVGSGTTVEEALEASGMEQDGYSITVNGWCPKLWRRSVSPSMC